MFKFLLLLFISCSALALETNQFQQFTKLLLGENTDNSEYDQMVHQKIDHFRESFAKPISNFSQEQLKSISGNTLFYPFAGADISYPLLLFPNFEQYILIGLEFAGDPNLFAHKFNLNNFRPQVEGYLHSGFFKTMNMSMQMQYTQGVIPMLVLQIGLLGGMVDNIEAIPLPFNGLKIDFIYQGTHKRLYYFRANLDDSIDKTKLYEFLANKLDGCMLKASSYKLQQPEFKQLRAFVLDNCKAILQDDTGVAVNLLHKYNIRLFGNYFEPYGSEFRPYFQKALNLLYRDQKDKIPLNFCYGYGCNKVEANILLATDTIPQN